MKDGNVATTTEADHAVGGSRRAASEPHGSLLSEAGLMVLLQMAPLDARRRDAADRVRRAAGSCPRASGPAAHRCIDEEGGEES